MPILTFQQITSSIDPVFWHTLTKLKLEVLKLDDSQDDDAVQGVYGPGKTIKDRETGKEIGLGCSMSFHEVQDSKDPSFQPRTSSPGSVYINGRLKNFNTIEEFKTSDKPALFRSLSDSLWSLFVSEKHVTANSMNTFLVVTFADLKKYRYYYWFAFPAFVAKPPWQLVTDNLNSVSEDEATLLHNAYMAHATENPSEAAACLVKYNKDKDQILTAALSDLSTFYDNDNDEKTLLFIDPSPEPDTVGWPLRNMLMFLHVRFGINKINIICWRDDALSIRNMSIRSLKGKLTLDIHEKPDHTKPSCVGWEKNKSGQLAPQMADLAPMMDPKRLADQAVDLNLKLMRWRLVPSLNLEKIKHSKCLLLGAGTLGCYVARSLLAWGVDKITFVDSSTVSFSNPVRQPLFNFEDSLAGGKPKAECAANSLKQVYPGVEANGVQLSIPMPGHPVTDNLANKTKEDVKILENLFDEHDIVFLLMDSRESRWLPTVLGAAKQKLVINAALGFDTFLVMRHGHGGTQKDKLGCYYCNDIMAPKDSLTDRTLDQMCTVTRPGLAAIASSTAVELMATVLQHPKGSSAPSETNDNQASPSILGQVPHQIRGSLSKFENMKITGQAFEKCTACSDIIVNTYHDQGFNFLLKAFNDEKYLESVTGLDKVHLEAESALENVDWDIDEEEDAADADDF